jgi:hypothetical protein
MSPDHRSRASLVRAAATLLAVVFVLAACRAIPTGLFGSDPEASPGQDPSPSPTAITKTLCESAADLRVDVDSLRSMELREDGLLSVLVAADAALGEAGTLRVLVAEEYGPYVAELVLALEGLRRTVDDLSAAETVGAGLESIGESIAEIGRAMDVLALELRDPCPENG